jgi:hypothetical protein
MGEMRVLPGYPDPNSGKLYRIQVGSYASPDSSVRVTQMLMAAGFDVIQELSGQLYRVLAIDIPAPMVYAAVQRLGALGIDQIWIREQ